MFGNQYAIQIKRSLKGRLKKKFLGAVPEVMFLEGAVSFCFARRW